MRFPHKTVPFSVFTEEIKNIWSEVKAIREKLVELHQLKENEKERNGNQEIQTLRQKNQDLQNEICMLKDQLREQNNMIKNISEERDSFRTALQIMTKERNAHKEKDLPQPVSADPDEHARKPVTVIAGDSIIQHICGWSISRSTEQGGCHVFSRSNH